MHETPSTKRKQRAHVQLVRSLLDQDVAKRGESPEIKAVRKAMAVLAPEMRNRDPLGRGRVTARSVTDEVRRAVWKMRLDNPDLAQKEIALALKIDVGRVSEILHGKRR